MSKLRVRPTKLIRVDKELGDFLEQASNIFSVKLNRNISQREITQCTAQLVKRNMSFIEKLLDEYRFD